MEVAASNQSDQNGVKHRQMDFVAHKPASASKTSSSTAAAASQPPVPVTSAKAAINAMYAKQAHKAEPGLAPSARETVNASARQGAGRNTKSASSLHHGAIQKDIDTSRTSAAALLQRAKSPKPVASVTSASDSYDPLASRLSAMKPTAKKKEDDKQEIPVIRTSLKLGAAARPKPAPVVLPPNARMARVARPVGGTVRKPSLLTRKPGDVQIIQPNTINAGHSVKRISEGKKSLPATTNEGELAVQVITKAKNLAVAKPLAKAPAQVVKSAPAAPVRVPRPTGGVRDPQMLNGATNRHPAKTSAAPLWPAAAATALGPKPKFRPAPKGYASAVPTGVTMADSYVIDTPPKLTPEYRPPEVRSRALPSIKADNTSDYSFSQPKQPAPKKNRYSSTEPSPFLKSVSVEKRPLSDSSAPDQFKIARPVVEEKPNKTARKNVYAKKKTKAEVRQELPQRPTVIVPASRRSKVPLFFLILFTIILGAVVGAAAYLCFFQ